jgi:replicative DNA helicase
VLASLEVKQHLGQHLFELEVRDPPSLRVCLDEIGLPIQEADGQKVRNALEACPKSESEASDVYWDRVVSITSQGLKQVFDLTVPGLHNFVAQDVFVHNTTFAMNLVEHSLLNVETPKPAIVFSLEMPGQQLLRRMIASIGKVDSSKIRKGSLSTSDMKKIVGTVVPRLARLPLFIDETQGLTPGDMRSRIRRVVRDHGKPGIVMVDYLQLMEANEKLDNPVQKYSAISRDLKRIAREFEVPLVALSQLNRGLEQRPNKRPVNSDLRESGAIEQDADVIMFVYRDEVYHPDNEDNRGLAEIIIGKQRNGPIGTVKLAFQHSYTRFDNLAPQRIASDYPEMGS